MSDVLKHSKTRCTPEKRDRHEFGNTFPPPLMHRIHFVEKNRDFGEFSFTGQKSLQFPTLFSNLSVCESVRPIQGSKTTKIGKRGFRSQKTPISPHPRKGRLESKNPHFYTGHHMENGDFLTRDALFWGGGKWGFFDSETLFSRFWGF